MKRGLILEGGGAKGAYQIGCLRAFDEHGIRFDAIAGTSVGALNGALASSHELEKGAEYWSTLSFRHVVKARWWFIPVPLLLLYVASYRTAKSEAVPPFTARNVGITAAYVAVMTVVAAFQGGTATVLYVLAIYCVFGVLWFAYFALRSVHFSVLQPSPLADFVSEVIGSGDKLTIPLYITLTDRQRGFDPDTPRLFYGKYNDVLVWGAVEDDYEYPNYFHINDLPSHEQNTLLLGSAALPLGIFPPIRMGSREYVDGGMSDNLPLFPLVSEERCDELVVIALRPTPADSLQKYWQEIDRRLRLRPLTVAEGKALYYSELRKRKGDERHAERYDPPVNLPLRQPEAWPSRVIVVSPQRELGTFLTGTMNFQSRYARRLMQQGYQDALAVIEEQFPDR